MLNSQLIVVLGGIICFSAPLYSNPLIVLKIHFSGLSFTRKKVYARVFQWQEYINVVGISALSSKKTMCQFFELLIFSQDILGNDHYVPELNNLILKGTLIEAFYLSGKTNYKKSETWFRRWKSAEDNNAKINVSLNTPCAFFLFKARAFLQFLFPRNLLFLQVLRTSVSLIVWHSFTYLFLYKRTSIKNIK